MKILATSLFLATSVVIAHPGTGIVVDSKDNVYYTDLRHVWKLKPDGTTVIAVRNVHTHELYIDQDDNVYGEHLWYEGETTDRWGHRIWKLSPDGRVVDIIPSRKGFRDDYDDFHFVRDRSGAIYWVDREDNAVRTRIPGGPIRTMVRTPFHNVRQLTVTSDGVVFLIDLFDLKRIESDGTLTTIARDIPEKRRAFVVFRNEHAIMGIAVDSAENVFAAVAADRAVKKITPNGTSSIVHRSEDPWMPTGVCVDRNGQLLVLEYRGNTTARVRTAKP